MSNIDFGAYQLKQNRFAKRVKKAGILLAHDAPSPASLKAILETDFGRLKSDAATKRSASTLAASLYKSVAGVRALAPKRVPLS